MLFNAIATAVRRAPDASEATGAAVEAVALSRRYGDGENAVDALIERVGLGERRGHKPSELSGGQQQRVAVARALVSRPTILFADEPTGNLDSRSGAEILGLLRETVDADGQTILMVTHDPRAAAQADRVLFLADGEIVRDLAACDEAEILKTVGELDR